MPRITVPTSRFRFHVRARGFGSYYINPVPAATLGSTYHPRAGFPLPAPGFGGLGQDFTGAINPFTGQVTPGSYEGGDVDASGYVTLQDAKGNRVSVGQLTSTGTLAQNAQQEQNQRDLLNQAVLTTQFWGQPTPPPSAGPVQSPGAPPRGIVSGSCLDGNTQLFGATVPNKLLAAGGALVLVASLARKKR